MDGRCKKGFVEDAVNAYVEHLSDMAVGEWQTRHPCCQHRELCELQGIKKRQVLVNAHSTFLCVTGLCSYGGW